MHKHGAKSSTQIRSDATFAFASHSDPICARDSPGAGSARGWLCPGLALPALQTAPILCQGAARARVEDAEQRMDALLALFP